MDFYFPKDIIGQYIFRCETLEDHYEGKNPSFGEVMARLKNTSVELVNEQGEKFNILNENLTDAVNASIYHNFIHATFKNGSINH